MVTGYCPFPVTGDPRRFGLTTSAMRLARGVVVVRHGRRTPGATATILLHGAAGSWTTWTPMLTAATLAAPSPVAVKADAHALPLSDLIIPDLPGWGESALPADRADRSVDGLAATVAEIARALGYRRWIVVGHSMGGFIALQLAASEPEATVGVGLVSPTTFSVIDSVQHPLTRFLTLPAYTSLLWVMRLLAALGGAGRALVRSVRHESLLRALASPLFSRPAEIPASVIGALATEVRPVGFAVASAQAGAYDAVTRWSAIVCPVRAVNGASDVFVAATDVDRLRGVIRGFTSVTVDGAGHFPHIERPGASLNALTRLNG
jgi:pimeloyl-ACP methyl ester carboxylesterase